MSSLVFEEIEEGEFLKEFTSTCTRVNQKETCWGTRRCTCYCDEEGPKSKDEDFATAEEWGKFLEIEGGVIQY